MKACRNIAYDRTNSDFYCLRFKGYIPKNCIEGRLFCYEQTEISKMKMVIMPKKKKKRR